MAKAPTVRVAVTARGVELLALIAGSEGGVMMLTQDEGAEAVAAGFATVNTAVVEGDTAAVSLTDAGKAELAKVEAPAKVKPVAAKATFDIDDAVAMPAGAVRKSRESGYPFDKLAVGQSFHVAATDATPDPVTKLQSSVSGARTKYSEKTGETETVTVKTYERNADGKGFVKLDGKRVVVGESTVTRDKLKVTRDFTVKAVDATDPRGPGARVWRTA